MSKHTPTAEQNEIYAAARTRESGVVKALAGTGKTSTLIGIAEDFEANLPEVEIAYCAFNTDIVTEAKGRFPANTEVRTIHSFAYHATVKANSAFSRVKNWSTASWEAAKVLGIRSTKSYICVDDEGNQTQRSLKTSTQAWIAGQTVAKFCRTAETEIEGWMVPKQDGFDRNAQARLAADILPYARLYWTLASSYTEKGLIMTHDIYLKVWQLSDPQIDADLILFDEAQDSNPCKTSIIQQQVGAQVIAVGDENQAIYAFTGAVNALDSFDAKWVLPLTKSFRFGPAIAATAQMFLDKLGCVLKIEGFDQVTSEVVGL